MIYDPSSKEPTSQTHWEKRSDGTPAQVRGDQSANNQPLNNDQQLRKDREVFAQSLPIDKLAEYKDALASGDPSKMDKFREQLSAAQLKLLKEIEARDPMTQVKGVMKMAGLAAGVEIMQDPSAFLEGLLGSGVVGRQSSLTPAQGAASPVQPGLGIPKLSADLKI